MSGARCRERIPDLLRIRATLALWRFYAKLGRNKVNPEKVRANDRKHRSAHDKSKKDDVSKHQFEDRKIQSADKHRAR